MGLRLEKFVEGFLIDPEEDTLVQHRVPVRGREPVVQAGYQRLLTQRTVVVDDYLPVHRVRQSHTLRTALTIDDGALGGWDFKHRKEAAGRQQPVLLNSLPVAGVGDVIEARVLLGEFFWSHGEPRSCSAWHHAPSGG